MAAIYQMIDGHVQVEDNHPWPLWASDAVYAQSVLEVRNEGFDQDWPVWAQQLIGVRHDPEVTHMSGARAFQTSILLANENRRNYRNLLRREQLRRSGVSRRVSELERRFRKMETRNQELERRVDEQERIIQGWRMVCILG